MALERKQEGLACIQTDRKLKLGNEINKNKHRYYNVYVRKNS